jgi:hypothetical protein
LFQVGSGLGGVSVPTFGPLISQLLDCDANFVNLGEKREHAPSYAIREGVGCFVRSIRSFTL